MRGAAFRPCGDPTHPFCGERTRPRDRGAGIAPPSLPSDPRHGPCNARARIAARARCVGALGGRRPETAGASPISARRSPRRPKPATRRSRPHGDFAGVLVIDQLLRRADDGRLVPGLPARAFDCLAHRRVRNVLAVPSQKIVYAVHRRDRNAQGILRCRPGHRATGHGACRKFARGVGDSQPGDALEKGCPLPRSILVTSRHLGRDELGDEQLVRWSAKGEAIPGDLLLGVNLRASRPPRGRPQRHPTRPTSTIGSTPG
jgi:hypothetical protein